MMCWSLRGLLPIVPTSDAYETVVLHDREVKLLLICEAFEIVFCVFFSVFYVVVGSGPREPFCEIGLIINDCGSDVACVLRHDKAEG